MITEKSFQSQGSEAHWHRPFTQGCVAWSYQESLGGMFGRWSDLMASALDSGLSGPCPCPGQGHCERVLGQLHILITLTVPRALQQHQESLGESENYYMYVNPRLYLRTLKFSQTVSCVCFRLCKHAHHFLFLTRACTRLTIFHLAQNNWPAKIHSPTPPIDQW